MKKQTKKLSLGRQTIAVLTPHRLRHVIGGNAGESCTCGGGGEDTTGDIMTILLSRAVCTH